MNECEIVKNISLEDGFKYNIELVHESEYKMDTIKECDLALKIPLLSRQNFDELFRKIDNNAMFLRASADKILGYVAFYLNDINREQAYITMLVVNPNFQNKRIGTELINMVEKIAESEEFACIRLEVASDNDKAINFYKKNGFEIVLNNHNKSYYMEKKIRK